LCGWYGESLLCVSLCSCYVLPSCLCCWVRCRCSCLGLQRCHVVIVCLGVVIWISEGSAGSWFGVRSGTDAVLSRSVGMVLGPVFRCLWWLCVWWYCWCWVRMPMGGEVSGVGYPGSVSRCAFVGGFGVPSFPSPPSLALYCAFTWVHLAFHLLQFGGSFSCFWSLLTVASLYGYCLVSVLCR